MWSCGLSGILHSRENLPFFCVYLKSYASHPYKKNWSIFRDSGLDSESTLWRSELSSMALLICSLETARQIGVGSNETILMPMLDIFWNIYSRYILDWTWLPASPFARESLQYTITFSFISKQQYLEWLLWCLLVLANITHIVNFK